MLIGFFGLPHGLELLEGNIHDQNAPQNRELAMLGLKGMLVIPIFPLDPKSPWGTLINSKHWPVTTFDLAHFAVTKPIVIHTCW